MPMPRLMARVNKRVFNPMEIRKGKRPVLIHEGRKSGNTYTTPLDAHEVEDGFVFIVVYGASGSDWVQNIMSSGRAVLRKDGHEYELGSPSIIGEEQAADLMSPGTKLPASFMNVTEYLLMKRL